MNKAELESCLVVLAGEMGFLRPLVSDTSAVLSADTTLAELEAALQRAEQDLGQQLHEYRQLRNVRLVLVGEITTHPSCWRLGRASWSVGCRR